MLKWMKVVVLMIVGLLFVACEPNGVEKYGALSCSKESGEVTANTIRVNYNDTEITYYVSAGTVMLDPAQSIGDAVVTDITNSYGGDHLAYVEQVKTDAEDDGYQCEYLVTEKLVR